MKQNMNCEMRLIFAVMAMLFLFAILFGKVFAIIGLIATTIVAITGVCMGGQLIGKYLCTEAMQNKIAGILPGKKEKAEDATDTAVEKVEDAVEEKAEDVAEKAAEKVEEAAEDAVEKATEEAKEVVENVVEKKD